MCHPPLPPSPPSPKPDPAPRLSGLAGTCPHAGRQGELAFRKAETRLLGGWRGSVWAARSSPALLCLQTFEVVPRRFLCLVPVFLSCPCEWAREGSRRQWSGPETLLAKARVTLGLGYVCRRCAGEPVSSPVSRQGLAVRAPRCISSPGSPSVECVTASTPLPPPSILEVWELKWCGGLGPEGWSFAEGRVCVSDPQGREDRRQGAFGADHSVPWAEEENFSSRQARQGGEHLLLGAE